MLKRFAINLAFYLQLMSMCSCTDASTENTLVQNLAPAVVRKNGSDSIIRHNCKIKTGEVLENCVSTLPVECFIKKPGEFCVQYTDADTARMWGPF